MKLLLNGAILASLLIPALAAPMASKALVRRQNVCNSWKEDFNNGMGPFSKDGQVTVENGKLIMKISPGNTIDPISGITIAAGAKVQSNTKILYGTVTARIKAARIGGVVSALVLMSPEKDEVDWEWVGKDEFSSQTNYYSKGELDYTKGVYIPNGFNVHSDFHDYSIKWTEEELVWLIDGNVVRTVKAAETGGKYPNTPSHIYFSLWDGGAGAPGTRSWAGGNIDFTDSEFARNGYMSAEVDSVSYTC